MPIAFSVLETTWLAARAARLVERFGFEQFRVGEDDPELVVETVKQQAQCRTIQAVELRRRRLQARASCHVLATPPPR